MHCEIKNQIIQYSFKAKYVLHLCNISNLLLHIYKYFKAG